MRGKGLILWEFVGGIKGLLVGGGMFSVLACLTTVLHSRVFRQKGRWGR